MWGPSMQAQLVRLMAAVVIVIAGATHGHAASRIACLKVSAAEAWQGTGVTLQEGDFVCIRARALWSHGQESGNVMPFYGPRGYFLNQDAAPQPIVAFPFARLGALIGKIGETGLAFPIEDGLCFAVEPTPGEPHRLPGELLLSMNDVPGAFANNEGAAYVAVALDRTGRATLQMSDRLALQTSHGSCFR